MFRYKIIQLQGETNITSELESIGSVSKTTNMSDSSIYTSTGQVQQFLKISLYSEIQSEGDINYTSSKEIQINGSPIPLYIKVRY